MTSPSLSVNSTAPERGAVSELVQETSALTKRLFLQLARRPSTLVAGVLQPLIWLILFGALFANAPEGLLPGGMSYGRFLGAGVIVFTAFSGALNAGLPVMFDREFGFLNRVLVAPLRSRSSVILASVARIGAISLIQSIIIMIAAGLLGYGWPSGMGTLTAILTLSILTIGVTALSLGLAFALPGHIELLAITFLINLPLLFSSTALAPIEFMPVVLKWLACINPLTYAIEPIRAAYQGPVSFSTIVLQAPFGDISAGSCIWILLILTVAILILTRPLLHRKLG